MALNKFYGHNFNTKICFGKNSKPVRNENNGTMKTYFNKLIGPFFCAPYTRTMHQNFQLMGTEFQSTRQIAVNHQWVGRKITPEMKYAEMNGEIYQIIDNSPDQTDTPNGVDILSLKLAKDISLPETEVTDDGHF